jgi:hypothetical protein
MKGKMMMNPDAEKEAMLDGIIAKLRTLVMGGGEEPEMEIEDGMGLGDMVDDEEEPMPKRGRGYA